MTAYTEEVLSGVIYGFGRQLNIYYTRTSYMYVIYMLSV